MVANADDRLGTSLAGANAQREMFVEQGSGDGLIIMNHTADQVRDEVVRSLFNGEGINLDALSPLDTICVQTRNSTYRIFLLDPKSGRSLIEGGHFAEPVDAVVSGAVVSESAIKFGWIGIGMRLEFWTNGGLVSTSPVQSFHVETPAPVESITIS